MEAVEFLLRNPGPVMRPGHSVTNLRSLPLAALQAAFSAIVLPKANHNCPFEYKATREDVKTHFLTDSVLTQASITLSAILDSMPAMCFCERVG